MTATLNQSKSQARRLKVLFQYSENNADGEILGWMINHEDGLRVGKEKGTEALRAFWLPLARKESGNFSPEQLQNAAKMAVWRLQEQIYYLQSTFNLELAVFGTAPVTTVASIVDSQSSALSLVQNEKIEEASLVPAIDFQSFDWSIKDGELGEKIAS